MRVFRHRYYTAELLVLQKNQINPGDVGCGMWHSSSYLTQPMVLCP